MCSYCIFDLGYFLLLVLQFGMGWSFMCEVGINKDYQNENKQIIYQEFVRVREIVIMIYIRLNFEGSRKVGKF